LFFSADIETILALCDALGLSVAAAFTTESEVVISAGAEDAGLFETIQKVPVELKAILIELFFVI